MGTAVGERETLVDEEVAKEMNEMGLVLVMDRVGANGDVEAGIGDNRLQLAVVNGTGRVWAVRNVTTAVGERRFRYLRGAQIFCGVCGDFRQVCCIGLVFVVVVLLVSCYNNVISVYRLVSVGVRCGVRPITVYPILMFPPTHRPTAPNPYLRSDPLSRFSSSLISFIAECSLTRQSSQQIQFFRRLLYAAGKRTRGRGRRGSMKTALKRSRRTNKQNLLANQRVSSDADTDKDKYSVTEVSFTMTIQLFFAPTLKQVIGQSADDELAKSSREVNCESQTYIDGCCCYWGSSIVGGGKGQGAERADGRRFYLYLPVTDDVPTEHQTTKTEVSQSSAQTGFAKPRTRSRKPELTRLSIPPTRPSVEKETVSLLSPIPSSPSVPHTDGNDGSEPWAKEKVDGRLILAPEAEAGPAPTTLAILAFSSLLYSSEKDAGETGGRKRPYPTRVTRATKGNDGAQGEGEVKGLGKEKLEGTRKGKGEGKGKAEAVRYTASEEIHEDKKEICKVEVGRRGGSRSWSATGKSRDWEKQGRERGGEKKERGRSEGQSRGNEEKMRMESNSGSSSAIFITYREQDLSLSSQDGEGFSFAPIELPRLTVTNEFWKADFVFMPYGDSREESYSIKRSPLPVGSTSAVIDANHRGDY
ncbi:hypothetical protein K435DRAFT_793222 [Dendrothele bispora CBS 962.96]|uniref:Uncharacterized protein n=1 Tax=Dendrothele bispora (strain CBS 962.96) TaxID=1314807 RepID=A0A4S8MHI1_DENBC|nr:hypothetical protein K435DRAFT_793222 [Dendrothele bispora CBS 962.96]